jgi:hypothetical protein
MSETSKTEIPEDHRHTAVPVNLRSPWIAAVYAWLWPGAGHIYQGRYAKGILFMVCVLSTYFFGFALGEGRVVYAALKPDVRYPYFAQVGVGIPALPAMLQTHRIRNGKGPLLGIDRMTPPSPEILAKWHEDLKGFFEVASLYTMVAGLLNMLAIYDAFAGPVFPQPEEKKKRGPPSKQAQTAAQAIDMTENATA